ILAGMIFAGIVLAAIVVLPVTPAGDDSPVRNAEGITAAVCNTAVCNDDWRAACRSAAEYTGSELLTAISRSASWSNPTKWGASGSAIRQTIEKALTMPSAGLQTRVATGRFASRIRASRSEASRARCTAAWTIDHRRSRRRCARLFSSSETRQVAYPCGFAVSASTASLQDISRSTESRLSIHHTAG